MAKPNRYDGSGKLYANGTVSGRYIMRNGHWVDQQSPLGAAEAMKVHSVLKASQWFSNWLAYITLIVLVVVLVGALAGCQVNVVNVIHSDIGLDTSSQTVNEGGRL